MRRKIKGEVLPGLSNAASDLISDALLKGDAVAASLAIIFGA
jgi:hypothetical protein